MSGDWQSVMWSCLAALLLPWWFWPRRYWSWFSAALMFVSCGSLIVIYNFAMLSFERVDIVVEKGQEVIQHRPLSVDEAYGGLLSTAALWFPILCISIIYQYLKERREHI